MRVNQGQLTSPYISNKRGTGISQVCAPIYLLGMFNFNKSPLEMTMRESLQLRISVTCEGSCVPTLKREHLNMSQGVLEKAPMLLKPGCWRFFIE